MTYRASTALRRRRGRTALCPSCVETQMQITHFSDFLLVDLPHPSLEAATSSCGEAPVVTHSSGACCACTGLLKEQSFWVSGPRTLGGDELPACFDRCHHTKVINSRMTMALQAQRAPEKRFYRDTVCTWGLTLRRQILTPTWYSATRSMVRTSMSLWLPC